MLRQFGGAVAQAAEVVKADGSGQSIAAFALVQFGCCLAAQLRLLQPVQGVERALDAADLAQSEHKAILPEVGGGA